jgi:hypothetical protein
VTRWEYCEVTWQPAQVTISFSKLDDEATVKSYDASAWPQLLARLGDEGWEMTGCMISPMQIQEYFMIFKRPVELD